MLSPEFYLPLILFCLVSTITPGPNNIMIMSSGLNHGLKKSVPHYLGITIGFPLMVAVIGFGLGAIFLRYPIIHLIIKVLCFGYLLFLAWKIANSSNADSSVSLRSPLTFIQSAGFQWINPKAWAMSIGVISAFTGGDDIQLQIIYIVITFFFVCSLCNGSWLVLGSLMQRFLHKPKHLQYFNITMACLLVLSVAQMVFLGISDSV